MKLKLKPEFEGVTITKNNYIVGQITLRPDTKPEHYLNYYKLGFDQYFDVIEDVKEETIKEQLDKDEPIIALYKNVDNKPKTNVKKRVNKNVNKS